MLAERGPKTVPFVFGVWNLGALACNGAAYRRNGFIHFIAIVLQCHARPTAVFFGWVFECGRQKQSGIKTRLGDDLNAVLPQGYGYLPEKSKRQFFIKLINEGQEFSFNLIDLLSQHDNFVNHFNKQRFLFCPDMSCLTHGYHENSSAKQSSRFFSTCLARHFKPYISAQCSRCF